MKLKNILLIALLLIILTTWVGAVSASQDSDSDVLNVNENLNTESSVMDNVIAEDSNSEANNLIGNDINNNKIEQSLTPEVKTTTNTATSSAKATPTITVKKATFKTKAKTKKLTATLKSGTIPIKNVKVYLKIGKKTYKAKTNSKGKATFKITKLSKKGKFKGTVSFKGNSKYQAVSKKLTAILTNKKCTIKSVNTKSPSTPSTKPSTPDKFENATGAFNALNAFRTTPNVWQWNKGDKDKTYFNTNESNTLQNLSWDSELEKTAKIRAKEIAESFSHTRPDGTSCWTAYPTSGYTAVGENIAMGTHLSGEKATELWKEENDLYDGQGHRRNMLDSIFNCVGIAGFEKDGYVYWVQCFGRK